MTEKYKKLYIMKVRVMPIVIGALGTIPKRNVKGTGRLRNKRTIGDHVDQRIVKTG